MNIRKIMVSALLATSLSVVAGNTTQTVAEVTAPVTLSEDVDYHISSANPFATTGSINITITASVTLVCYIMYTVSPEVTEHFGSGYLYLTSVFVLLGLLRYIQIAVVDQKSGDPVKVALHDRFSQLIVLAWLVSYLILIYL